MNPPKFQIGDLVRKTKGSQWSGTVVGTYSTELTPEGYAVESSTEKGSVQIYPAAALEGVRAEISVPISQIAGLQAVGEALSGNPKALAAVEQLIEEVGRLQKASVPVCVGRELIQILAAEGQWVSMDGHGLIAADGLFRKDPYIELEKAQAEVEELRGKLNCLEQVSVSPMENPDLDWIDAMRRDKEDRDATRTKIAGLEKEVLRLKENRPAENQVLLAQLEAQVRTIQGYRMACDEKVSEINAAQVEVERLKSEVLRLRHNAAKQDAVFDGEIASLRDSAKAADEISSHQISTIASERDRLMKRCNELTLALLSKEAGKIIEWESCERERDALRKKVAEVEPVSLIGAASRPVGSVSTIHQYDAQACCNQLATIQRKADAATMLYKCLRRAMPDCEYVPQDELDRECVAALTAWDEANK